MPDAAPPPSQNPPTTKPLGARIRDARKARRWTRRHLAREVKMGASTVAVVEQKATTGRGGFPETAAAKLAAFLGVPLGEEHIQATDHSDATTDLDDTTTTPTITSDEVEEVGEHQDTLSQDAPIVHTVITPQTYQRMCDDAVKRALPLKAPAVDVTVTLPDTPLLLDPATMRLVTLRRESDPQKLLWALLQREHPGDTTLHRLAIAEQLLVTETEATRLSALAQAIHDSLDLAGHLWDATPIGVMEVAGWQQR